MANVRLGDKSASTRIVSGRHVYLTHRCRVCNREMEETTRSRLEMMGTLMELRCPAGCMTRTTARGERKRSGNPMIGAGKRVNRWM